MTLSSTTNSSSSSSIYFPLLFVIALTSDLWPSTVKLRKDDLVSLILFSSLLRKIGYVIFIIIFIFVFVFLLTNYGIVRVSLFLYYVKSWHLYLSFFSFFLFFITSTFSSLITKFSSAKTRTSNTIGLSIYFLSYFLFLSLFFDVFSFVIGVI